MGRITISELFPIYSTAIKWYSPSEKEIIRLEKEYTEIFTSEKDNNGYTEVRYICNNHFHRRDGPATIAYIQGKLYRNIWYLHGKSVKCKIYKDDKIYTEWYGICTIDYHDWYKGIHCIWNLKLHRINGPCYIEYHNDKIINAKWYRDGKPHRWFGPAIIRPFTKQYYWYGYNLENVFANVLIFSASFSFTLFIVNPSISLLQDL